MNELEGDVVLVVELVRGVEAGAGLDADAEGDAQRKLGVVLARGLVNDAERLPVDPLH